MRSPDSCARGTKRAATSNDDLQDCRQARGLRCCNAMGYRGARKEEPRLGRTVQQSQMLGRQHTDKHDIHSALWTHRGVWSRSGALISKRKRSDAVERATPLTPSVHYHLTYTHPSYVLGCLQVLARSLWPFGGTDLLSRVVRFSSPCTIHLTCCSQSSFLSTFRQCTRLAVSPFVLSRSETRHARAAQKACSFCSQGLKRCNCLVRAIELQLEAIQATGKAIVQTSSADNSAKLI